MTNQLPLTGSMDYWVDRFNEDVLENVKSFQTGEDLAKVLLTGKKVGLNYFGKSKLDNELKDKAEFPRR